MTRIVRPFDWRTALPDQQPSVGRIVHYVSFGTPGGEFKSECRAAVVTEVELGVPNSLGGERVGLAVLNPTGIFLHSLAAGGCRYDEGAEEPESPDCLNPEIHGNPMRYRDAGQCSALEGGGEGPRWEGRQGPEQCP